MLDSYRQEFALETVLRLLPAEPHAQQELSFLLFSKQMRVTTMKTSQLAISKAANPMLRRKYSESERSGHFSVWIAAMVVLGLMFDKLSSVVTTSIDLLPIETNLTGPVNEIANLEQFDISKAFTLLGCKGA